MKKVNVKSKKRIRKQLGGFLILSFLFVLLGLGIYLYFGGNKKELQLENKDKSQSLEKKYSLSMVMVGDNLIHDKIYQEAKENAGGIGYDFRPMLEMIKPLVSIYDIAYYNQETILGGSEIGLSSYPAFNSPYEVGDAMIDAGFNLVSLATNHTMDRGTQAILNSRAYWNGKGDVLAVGSYASENEKKAMHIVEKDHITYTMLNYTYGTNGIRVPSDQDYLVNVWPVMGNDPRTDSVYQGYKENVRADIEKVRDKVDVLIVAMHWGIEYQSAPSAYQKDMASYLASLGVDIIIGTHPHVIQPIEWIGDTLVIYSLGNFVSAHEVVNMANRIGLMSSISITKIERKGEDDDIRIDDLENELLYMYYTSDYHDFKVIPFSNMGADYLVNYKEVYEEYKNVVQALDHDIYVKSLK